MDIRALRGFINTHPDGVILRMVDGAEYPVPHRDWVWFTPPTQSSTGKSVQFPSSFYLAVDGVGRLVNALLVAEVIPISRSNGHSSNGNGNHGKGGKRGKSK